MQLNIDQKTTPTNIGALNYTHGSLFAGIGGICQSFNKIGFTNEFVNELDEKAIKTYAHNHQSNNIFAGSVADLKAVDLVPVDVLHGGFPCQSFSIAGHQGGFNDPRGMLFFEITRLIAEFKEKKPKIIVLENAPNLIKGDSGAWFRKVMMEIAKLGYWFDQSSAVLLNTAFHTGIPQSRERLFIICFNADYFDSNPIRQSDFKKVSLKPLSQFINLDSDEDKSYYLDPDNKYSRLIMDKQNKNNPYQIYQLRKFEVRLAAEGMCPTLTANMGHGGHNVPFIITKSGVRKLTERECLNLQGFESDFVFPDGVNSMARYAMIGNAVSPPVSLLVAKRVEGILKELHDKH